MKVRILIVVVLTILYALLGSYMQTKGWIVEPANWALYGFLFGLIEGVIILTGLDNP